MKRQPSVHIKKGHLVLVLQQVLTVRNSPVKWDYDKLADDILTNSKQYSLTNRRILVDKPKLLKSTNKIVLSTRDDAGVFAQLLVVVRRKRNHRGISLIKVGSREWSMVKEVAGLATSFCEDFGLKREVGYRTYIEIALDKMTSFNLSRFNNYHQAICDTHAANEVINNDITQSLTLEIRDIYDKFLAEKTGLVNKYTPDKYVFFIRAKEAALAAKIDNHNYIASQFKGLEWCNSYPEPNQLVGEAAQQRLNKFLATNKIKTGFSQSSTNAIEAGKLFRQKLDNDNNKSKK